MKGSLTNKKAKVSAAQTRVSALTNDHHLYFKTVFSHQIEPNFTFSALRHSKGNTTTDCDYARIFKALGKFLDDSVKLTITEVENKYGRPTDFSDGSYDPDLEDKAQVVHFCLYSEGDSTNGAADSVRLHGYYKTNGYFVLTRLDWFHGIH